MGAKHANKPIPIIFGPGEDAQAANTSSKKQKLEIN